MAKASERSFKYQRRDRESLKERANAKGGNFDTFIKPKYKVYKVKDGKNVVRILPPTWEGAKHYGYDIWVNYSIGVDNQSYLSLSKMLNKPDPLAEARRQADRDGEEKLAKDLMPRQRILMWVIDRMAEDEGPQLWPAAFTVDKDLANLAIDEDTKEVVYIDDPEEGCDLRFYKEGSGITTKYPPSKMRLLAKSYIHEDEKIQQEWIDFITDNPIPECLQYYDYEHIEQTFDGQAGRKDDDDDVPRKRRPRDDDEDAKPAARTRRPAADDEPAPRRRTRESEAEKDEEPAPRRRGKPDPEETDEEPAPRRRPRAEPEDEAAEETAPRRRAPREEPAEEAPRRRRPVPDEEPADEEVGESIRDKLAKRRGEASGKRAPRDADPEDD